MNPTVTQIKPNIGAEITGVSGHDFVAPGVAAEAQRLLDAHGVLIYRDAHIEDEDLSTFTRLLGPVHEFPEVSVVSLDPEMSKSAAVQRGTFQWHIDGTMVEYPHQITLLSCLEPAKDGSGDTEFANTYAAYEALSDAEKAELEGLQVLKLDGAQCRTCIFDVDRVARSCRVQEFRRLDVAGSELRALCLFDAAQYLGQQQGAGNDRIAGEMPRRSGMIHGESQCQLAHFFEQACVNCMSVSCVIFPVVLRGKRIDEIQGTRQEHCVHLIAQRHRVCLRCAVPAPPRTPAGASSRHHCRPA